MEKTFKILYGKYRQVYDLLNATLDNNQGDKPLLEKLDELNAIGMNLDYLFDYEQEIEQRTLQNSLFHIAEDLNRIELSCSAV